MYWSRTRHPPLQLRTGYLKPRSLATFQRIATLTNQTNYADWALEIEATARLGNFWKAYSGGNKPSSTTPDAAEVDQVETREEKAIGLILKTVSPNLRVELKALPAPTAAATPISQHSLGAKGGVLGRYTVNTLQGNG